MSSGTGNYLWRGVRGKKGGGGGQCYLKLARKTDHQSTWWTYCVI